MAIQNVYKITIIGEGNSTKKIVFSAKERDEIISSAKKRGKKAKVATATYKQWQTKKNPFI